jgi:tripeptide aminopeptidase
MKGDCSDAKLDYIIRDHDKDSFEARKATLQHIQKFMNEKWGAHRVKLDIHDEYQNMNVIIKDHMHLIENAKKAAIKVGIEPLVTPVRGGTDGCQLSFKGLPCPNLGTGGHAFHGLYEHITVEGMDLTVDMLLEIVKLYAE